MSLDRVVTLRTLTDSGTVDDQFDPIFTTADADLWVRLEESQHEYEAAESPISSASHVYMARWTAELHGADPSVLSIVEGSRVLQVLEIRENLEHGRRRFLELHVAGRR